MLKRDEPGADRDKNSLWPLLWLLLNLLLVVFAAIAGGIGLLFAGEWLAVIAGIAAVMIYPTLLMLLHWLRWLADIPAMFASDARWHLLAAIFDYLGNLFVAVLVLGWVAGVVWQILPLNPAWAALAWGYALVAGPLLFTILRPAGYPLLVLLVLIAQVAYPVAWVLFHSVAMSIDNLLRGITLLALFLPLLRFCPLWRKTLRPEKGGGR